MYIITFTFVRNNATKPNPVEFVPLQTTRKENNWKIEETLARTVVTLETERIRLVQSLMFIIIIIIIMTTTTKRMQCKWRCEHDKATWHALSFSFCHMLYFPVARAGEVIICWKMEDWGNRLLLNVSIFVPDHTASHLRLLIFTNVKFSNSSEVVLTVYVV